MTILLTLLAILAIVLVLLMVVYAICSLRIIREDEMAGITWLGKPWKTVDSGLNFVPFLLAEAVLYPTVKIEIEPNPVSVITAETDAGTKDAVGSAPATLRAISVRAKFSKEELLNTMQHFPKPPKRKADGGWEALGEDWKTLLDEAFGAAARDLAGKKNWRDLFNTRDKLGADIRNRLRGLDTDGSVLVDANGNANQTPNKTPLEQFPCFKNLEVTIGEVDLGPLAVTIARQETARQEAQGLVVEADNYAVVTKTKATADKEAAILKGQGAARATEDQIAALGGDPRTLAAIELAKSGSTVVLPSGIVDAIGGIGGKTTNVHLGGGSPNAAPEAVAPDSEVPSGAAERQTHDSIERQVATLEAAGVSGLKDVLKYLPADQQKLLLKYLEVDAEEVEMLSVRTAVSMLSPKQKRIVFQWFIELTKKGEV